MKCSIAAFMSNICSRIIYTVIIANFLILIAIFAADVLFSTLQFSQFLYSKEPNQLPEKFTYITDIIEIATHFFKIPLPGSYQTANYGANQCLVFRNSSEKVEPSDLPETAHMLVGAFRAYFQDFSCIDGDSYKQLSEYFFYNYLNLILLFVVILSVIGSMVTFISIFFCCNGWCGCRCCRLFTICFKDEGKKVAKKQRGEKKQEQREQFEPIRDLYVGQCGLEVI